MEERDRSGSEGTGPTAKQRRVTGTDPAYLGAPGRETIRARSEDSSSDLALMPYGAGDGNRTRVASLEG